MAYHEQEPRYGWLVATIGAPARRPATRDEAVRALGDAGEEYSGSGPELRVLGRPARWDASDEVVSALREELDYALESWRGHLYRRRP